MIIPCKSLDRFVIFCMHGHHAVKDGACISSLRFTPKQFKDRSTLMSLSRVSQNTPCIFNLFGEESSCAWEGTQCCNDLSLFVSSKFGKATNIPQGADSTTKESFTVLVLAPCSQQK